MSDVISIDDEIMTNIVQKIKNLNESPLSFDVERDRTRPWQNISGPVVNVEQEEDNPEGEDSFSAIYNACWHTKIIIFIRE